MGSGFERFLEGMGKVLEIAPQVYDDGIKPTVVEAGKLAALPLRCARAALVGVECWISQREYKREEMGVILASKLKNINPKSIVPPEQHVFIPALQAISYCMDNEELKNMFANLLAKSMIKEYTNYVHPSFVEIIKQMSPLDAQNLKLFKDKGSLPICDYVLLRNKTQEEFENALEEEDMPALFETDGLTVKSSVFMANKNESNQNNSALSISSLLRLGLLEKAKDSVFPTKVLNKDILNYQSFKEEFDTLKTRYLTEEPNFKLNVIVSSLNLTEIGQKFIEICLTD
ncbi:MAG: DUF4393 domain-containing protein [Clostridiaceae bacterium]|nr:DUF4393 domain-containing protein [Clostridiaceae bacterium]